MKKKGGRNKKMHQSFQIARIPSFEMAIHTEYRVNRFLPDNAGNFDFLRIFV